MSDSIAEKIRKLLALAEGAANEHESASAAAMAARLMERHAISEAHLKRSDDSAAPETVTFYNAGPRARKRARWRGRLALAVAGAHGAYVFWRGPHLMGVGRRVDVDAARVVFDYCAAEIERLTATRARGRGRSFANGFRHGCVTAVLSAIERERAALRAEMAAEGVSETALVVVDTRAQRAREATGKLGKLRSYGVETRGYVAGRSAGEGIYSRATRGKLGGGE